MTEREKIKNEVSEALKVLKSGGIILYPTDTIWGIGCDATNEEAVQRILALKKRPETKSMIILLDNPNRLSSYVKNVPEQAWQLIEYSEKPLTIVYDGGKNLAPGAIAKDGSVAIRITKDEFCCQLIAGLKKPIISTSANISEEAAPTAYSKVSETIRLGTDYIVNLRRDEIRTGHASTIIRLKENGQISFIRK